MMINADLSSKPIATNLFVKMIKSMTRIDNIRIRCKFIMVVMLVITQNKINQQVSKCTKLQNVTLQKAVRETMSPPTILI